mgnify:FL=1
MNKKKMLFIILICILLIFVAIVGILFFIKRPQVKEENSNNSSVIYDSEGHVISDLSKKDDITETVENTVIQGIVELHSNGYIYTFNGQHFGEFGFEMDEYTRANIADKKQKCINYLTLQEYDTDYIEEGDLLICSGTLYKKGYSGENDFDTKDNAIIVLKSNDYNNMKLEVLKGNSIYPSTVTIGESYAELGYVYLKYSLEDDTHSDTGYNFPFAIKAYITENTKVIGKLENGKTVKVQYKNLENQLSELELESIEIIEK